MLRTAVATTAVLFNPRSGAGEAFGVLAGLVVGALMLVLALAIPVLMAVEHLAMEKNFTRYSQAQEKSFAVDVAKFYKVVIPQAAFDAYAALPMARLQAGEPGYKRGVGLKADFQNAKWGWLALYLVGAWVFLALQFAVVFGLMFLFGRVWMPLMWIPFIAAIVHYAMPFYLNSHFKYMPPLVQ